MNGPQIRAHVHFLPADAGGRKTDTPTDRFGCIMEISGKNLDVSLMVGETGPVAPGNTVEIDIQFLDWESARTVVDKGSAFTLRDFRRIGQGVVLKSYV